MECLLAEGQVPQAPVILPWKGPQARSVKELFKNLPSVKKVLQPIGVRIHEGRPLELVLLEGVDGRELVHMIDERSKVLLHHLQGFHPHNVGKVHLVTEFPSEVHDLASVREFKCFLVLPKQVATIEHLQREANAKRLDFSQPGELLCRGDLRPQVEDLPVEAVLLRHPLEFKQELAEVIALSVVSGHYRNLNEMGQVGEAVLAHPVFEEDLQFIFGFDSLLVVGGQAGGVAEAAPRARRPSVWIEVEHRLLPTEVVQIAHIFHRIDRLANRRFSERQNIAGESELAFWIDRKSEEVVKLSPLLGVAKLVVFGKTEIHPDPAELAVELDAVDIESDEQNVFQGHVIALCKTSRVLYSKHY